MTAWLDGQFVATTALPMARGDLASPFETMGAVGAELPLWDHHLARLAATARRLGVPLSVTPRWRAVATELLLQNGHGDDVLRLGLVRAAHGDHVVMQTRARGPVGRVLLVPTVVERTAGLPPGDIKAWPRTFYDAVRQQAQDAGADDGIVIGGRGEVLETAIANLWLRLDGTWTTPLLDGRVLPGIARGLLLERARAAGLAAAEGPCSLGDLHRAQALAVSNAVHGVRPAQLLAGPAAAVDIVDSELGGLWRTAATG